MKKTCEFLTILIMTGLAQTALANCPTDSAYPEALFPELTIQTSMGDVVVELDRSRAPLTVNHVLHLVKEKKYDNTLIHRVVPDYVVQMGAFNTDHTAIESCGNLFNESGNGLSNDRGTVAMARYDAPHSAGTSFFINLKDNENLNPSKKNWGYTVFGYVVSGMDVVDRIAEAKTGFDSNLDAKDVPETPIEITQVRINP